MTPTHNISRFIVLISIVMAMAGNAMGQNKFALKATELVDRLQFGEAEDNWLKAIAKDPENATYYEGLGYTLKKLNKYQEAEKAFDAADSVGGLSETGRIYYSQVLLTNGKPEASNRQIQQYILNHPENFLVRQMIQSLDKLTVWDEQPSAFVVNTMQGVNTQYSEFAPIVFNNELIFSSARGEDLVNNNGSSYSNEGYLTIYKSAFEDQNLRQTKRAKAFSSKLTGDFQTGPLFIDAPRNEVYYSRVNSSLKKNKINYILSYKADLVKGKKIRNQVKLPFNVSESSNAHPTISPSGKFICFASDRPGGKGKMDLYIIQKTDSNWSTPMHLDSLNTELNEVFPYFLNDSTLFFSSDGLPGYGGLDIFRTTRTENGWSKPINLKAPLNSNKDDFGIFYLNNTKGYFSSNREGGQGKDDIYQFIQIAEPSENGRTEIAGIFEFKGLPAQGVTLKLLNEDDNEIMVVETDSNGFFDFGSLPANESYKIEVAEKETDYLNNSQIYLVNQDGQKVIFLNKEAGGLFVFESLNQEKIEALSLLSEEDTQIASYDIFGQLFKKLEREKFNNLLMNVYDQDGNFVTSSFVSEDGYYEIRNLSKSRVYRIEVAGDSNQYSSTVFYDDGYSVKQFEENNSSLFSFQKMKVTTGPVPSKTVITQILITNRGKELEKARVRVFDNENKNLGGALTDSLGKFSFNGLSESETYHLVLADSLDSAATSKIEIFILDSKGNRVSIAQKTSSARYTFNTLTELQYAATNSKAETYEIFGQIFFKRPGDFDEFITITAKNTNNQLVEKATTNENGFFKFKELLPNERYAFSLSKQYIRELYVYFYDNNNRVIDTLLFADFSKYVFEKLKADESARLALFDEHDKTKLFTADLVNGQIFKKLPGDYKQGIKIYAYDDKGNVLDSAYTDEKGNFAFEQLKRDERFTLKIADETDGELNIAFMNFDGHFEGAIKTNELNEYVYSKIVLEAAAELGLEDYKDGQYEPLYGQLFKRLPGDYTSGTKIYAYDDDGNIVDIAIIDGQGNFKFTKLKRDENYLFRTDNQDGEFNINVLDSEGGLLDRISVKDKTWVYTQLKREENSLSKIKEQADKGLDLSKYITPERKELPSNQQTIYYNYKSYKLSEEDIVILNSYIEKLKENSALVFDIQSHTDPSERTSQRSYSALRSVSIANYIHDQGIGLEQIEITNWEEQKLAVQCPNDSVCDEETRLKNMRTELALVDMSTLPRKPDYFVYYGFDQWTLSSAGNEQMFKVLKAKELDKSKQIILDGYTDVWGGYEMNERISDLRVQNVKNILIREGQDPMTIITTIHGESKPMGACKLQYPCSIKDRQQNRRVEIRLEP